MIGLLWCLGFGIAGMVGVALGGSFVQERGRRVLPVVIVATLAAGALLGWGLTGEYAAMQSSIAAP